MNSSDWRQHAGQDLEAQVPLVSDSIGAPLDDADLVVEVLHETHSDLVLRLAVCRNPLPSMTARRFYPCPRGQDGISKRVRVRIRAEQKNKFPSLSWWT